MRKKIMTLKCLLIAVFITVLLIMPTAVQAYSGEIDPKNYINLPYLIDGETGEGTITISSSAGTGYTVYYQYEIMTSTQYNQIDAAMSEYESALEEAETELNQLYEEYERLKEDENATAEQINDAYEAYQTLYENKSAELDEKEAEIYALYPTYKEGNWKQTNDNKVKIDLTNYSGEIHYMLWVKLVNSEGTYYDVGYYRSIGTKKITLSLNKTNAEIEVGGTVQLTATTDSKETVTWTSNKENIATVNSSGLVTGVAEGVATITAEVEGEKESCTVTVKAKKQNTEQEDDEDEDGLTWTDFSNAKVKLVREDYDTGYFIVVNNVSLFGDRDSFGRRYQIYVSTDPNSMPDLKQERGTTDSDWRDVNTSSSSIYNKDEELGVWIRNTQYERAGEQLYVWVREYQYANGVKNYKLVLDAVPITRLGQTPIGTRFSAFFFHNETSVFLNDYYDVSNKSVKYKIGKVTDISILKAIKNGESGCLEKLMNYAKSSSGGYTGTCIVGNSNSITNKLGLVDDAYYYVYMELDTENGKYYPIEDVSLYQASCYSHNGKYYENLYDYLDDKFVWNLGDEQTPTPSTPKEPEDTTTSTEKLPNTGKTIVITIMTVCIVTIGIVSYKKYKNLKGI